MKYLVACSLNVTRTAVFGQWRLGVLNDGFQVKLFKKFWTNDAHLPVKLSYIDTLVPTAVFIQSHMNHSPAAKDCFRALNFFYWLDKLCKRILTKDKIRRLTRHFERYNLSKFQKERSKTILGNDVIHLT